MQVDSNSVNNVSFYSACKDALPVWKREFLSVRVERNVLVINREVLNVFQRMLRYLHLAYLDTIVDQTKINRWYAVDSTRTRAVVGALRARGKGGILPRNEGGINVLMAGRSRCGKSTLAKLLELPKITCSEDFPQDPSNGTIFRATRDPILLKPIHVLDSLNQSHTLHILDTPGLSELVPVGREKRSDDTILDSIETCASLEFGGQGLENVDVVLLPFSMGAGINKADIEAIKEFDKKVTETAKKTNKLIKIFLIITRAENFSDAQTAQTRHEAQWLIQKEQLTSPFSLLFSGYLENSNASNEDTLENIQNYRKSMVDAICSPAH